MAQMALRLLLRLDGADRARGDSGLYNCTALNAYGVTYFIVVIVVVVITQW